MKILLTGAAGALGSVLRPALADLADTLVCTDVKPAPGALADNETWMPADLAELDQAEPLCDGVDVIVHLASIPDEAPFEDLLRPNFLSAYAVWEAAHRAGVSRIVYASSVHAVGMHETNRTIDTDAPHRPDTFYGLAKCFTEDLARLYWEKRGLETVACRIFSCSPEPQNVRALSTWLSHGDLVRLVTAAIACRTVGFTTVYGVSANTRMPVSNARAAFLGYVPRDDAEDWAAELTAREGPADPSDGAQMRLGGPFATIPLGQSGVAAIKAMADG